MVGTTEIIGGNHVRVTYYGLDELVEGVKETLDNMSTYQRSYVDGPSEFNRYMSVDDAMEMCATGWEEGLQQAMPLVDEALNYIEQEDVLQEQYEPHWDITGGMVDMGRYVTGEPECMIDYEPVTISKSGRVITLVSSCEVSASISTDTIIKRGAVITALALALEKTGHAIELWADMTVSQIFTDDTGSVRVRVKGPNDVVDPSRIAFAYSHPAFLRQLLFTIRKGFPERFKRSLNVFGGCTPEPMLRDLPEGTIYVPEVKSSRDIPEIADYVMDVLKELGLTREGV